MNIHQLLSTSLSSPQTQSPGAFSQQSSPNGFFQQALLQASGAQHGLPPTLSEAGSSQLSTLQAQLDALSNLLADALEVDGDSLSTALETLGLDISESDLSELLAQLQMPTEDISTDALGLNGAEASTPLDEIAARLALMASFSKESPQALTESPIDSVALETIADHLNINQTEATQLISTLNSMVAQQHGTQRLSVQPLPVEPLQAVKPQPDALVAQINTGSAAPQISSEALMGAMLMLENAPKGNQTSEHLLTGFSLSSNNGQVAPGQPTQGFSPTVAPTQASLTTSVNSPAWPQQLGQQLVQISQRGGEQHVQMQLHPAELGPLSISLKFGEQGAQAHFLSAHAQVRQVLEQAIPQLREALAEQGISLGETSVGEQRDPNAQAFAQSGGQQGAGLGSDDGDISGDETLSLGTESSPLRLDGRVDLYA